MLSDATTEAMKDLSTSSSSRPGLLAPAFALTEYPHVRRPSVCCHCLRNRCVLFLHTGAPLNF